MAAFDWRSRQSINFRVMRCGNAMRLIDRYVWLISSEDICISEEKYLLLYYVSQTRSEVVNMRLKYFREALRSSFIVLYVIYSFRLAKEMRPYLWIEAAKLMSIFQIARIDVDIGECCWEEIISQQSKPALHCRRLYFSYRPIYLYHRPAPWNYAGEASCAPGSIRRRQWYAGYHHAI